jgi:hypothetical protein
MKIRERRAMKGPSISDLLARLTQLEERTARAEERAAKAEAKAAQLEYATGNLAAAVVNPKAISRRNLLMKAAGVGAAGVAGSLILNRKEAGAIFTWQGGAGNVADLQTTVAAVTGFPAGAVLRLDANQAGNGATNIDGIQAIGTNDFSGIAAYGGNHAGTGAYIVGGNAPAAHFGGPAIRAFSGVNVPSQFSYVGEFFGHGASDGTAYGAGVYSAAAGSGDAIVAFGGSGTTASPHVGGGGGVYASSGPNAVGGIFYGDGSNSNPALESHGVFGFGNALGVGALFNGGRAQIQLGPSATVGPPLTLQHFRGDLFMDANEVIWVCIANGTPGVFSPLQPGGMNNALFTTVSTSQYTLSNSDGLTWASIDATNLKLIITPTFNCQAVLNGSADLWTANAGFNQDIGIMVSGGAFPTTAGQPEGWKESGGFAGTFSPNAAGVETIIPFAVGVTYTVTLVWKTNHSGSSTIAAGAGPIGGKFSPTRLTARLIPTKAGGLSPIIPYQAPAVKRPPTPAPDAHRT